MLHKGDLSVLQQCGRIHHTLAGLGIRLGGIPHDDRNTLRLVRDLPHDAFPLLHERGLLHQIAWRISGDRQFGKKDQARAGRTCAAREFEDFGGVPGEVANRGIDLPKSNLHWKSLNLGTITAQSSANAALRRTSREHTWPAGVLSRDSTSTAKS